MPKMNHELAMLIIKWLLAAVGFFGMLAFLTPAFGRETDIYFKPPKETEVELPRLIAAIKAAENWDGKSVGEHGEEGAMQFKRETWRQFSSRPSWYAAMSGPVGGDYSRETARVENEYARWLIQSCRALGRQPSVWLCAAIHAAGYGNVERGSIGAIKRDYANRCENLYEVAKP